MMNDMADKKTDNLHCPQCYEKFTFPSNKNVGDGNAKGTCPFLLSCGHNICGNCYQRNRDYIFECSVCSKLHDLSSNEQQSNEQQSNESVNNIACAQNDFDMNFFLVGKLSDLNADDNIELAATNHQTSLFKEAMEAHNGLITSRKALQTVESQLDQYGKTTLEGISSFFLSLHSFLQNEEKRLTNKVTADLLKMQNDLNQAFQKCESHNEEINRMINDSKMDAAISENVLHTYQEGLRKLIWGVHPEKIQVNPFEFHCNMNILKDLPHYYKMDLNDLLISFKPVNFIENSNTVNIPLNQALSNNSKQNNTMEPINRKPNAEEVINVISCSKSPSQPLTNTSIVHSDEHSLKRTRQSTNENHCQMPDHNQAKNKRRSSLLQDTGIVIIHAIDPGEFYVQLSDQFDHIQDFYKKLQQTYDNKYKKFGADQYNSKEWQVNDNCVVHVKYTHEILLNSERCLPKKYNVYAWHRAIIKNVTKSPKITYKVFLRDIGLTLHDVSCTQIYPVEEGLNPDGDAVYRCHLACIAPLDADSWSQQSINYFRNLIKEYVSFSMTLKGKRDPVTDSTPIVLWALREEIVPSQLSTTIDIVNIRLVKYDLADVSDYLNVPENSNETIEEINLWIEQLLMMEINAKYNVEMGVSAMHTFDDGILMGTAQCVLESAETDINEQRTIDEVIQPSAWCLPHAIKETTVYLGYSTHIDENCTIYIQGSKSLIAILELCRRLGELYGTTPQPPISYKYSIGQHCVAPDKFYNMNKLYRCIVMVTSKKEKKLPLYYVDYGFIEYILPEYIRPYNPYPNSRALVNKFRIAGIKPKGASSKYNPATLDFMRSNLVGHSVTVHMDNPTNNKSIESIYMCTIKRDSINIKYYAVSKGYVDLEYANPASVETSSNRGNI